MSFLFRSLFQGGAGSAEPGPGQQPFVSSHPGMMGAASSSHPLMQSSAPSFSQSPADSPFKMSGAPLFKTAGNEAVAAPPINSAVGMSPFSVQGAASTSFPLTVGDVMTQIPPEIARAGALPAEHPLSLPPALLESALRSGEPALPLFELYRVCPKLFQTPVSPQDPRLVKLPAAKLPGLIARTREGLGAEAANAPASAAPAESPFAFAPQAAAQPPAPFPAAAPVPQFQMAAPAAPPSESVAASPFASPPMRPFAAASPFSMGGASSETPPASPFVSQQEATPASGIASSAAAPSPFGMNGMLPASPTLSPQPQPLAPVSPSLFGMAQPFAAAAPASVSSPAPSAPTSASPAPISLSGLFTPKAPENTLAPQMQPPVVVTPAAPVISPMPAFTPAPNGAPSAQGMVKLGFAAILSGYSVEELGFNPAMIPTWMMTSVPAATLNEQLSAGAVMMELGTLIDGLADVGFRNTLTAAKRSFQVKLPQNEVFHALTNATSAPAPAPAVFGAATPFVNPVAPLNAASVIQPNAASAFGSSMVTPPQPTAPPLFVSPQPTQHPLTAFAASGSAMQENAPRPLTPQGGAFLNAPEQPEVQAGLGAMPQAQPSPAIATATPALSAFAMPFGSPPSQPQSSPLAPLTKPFDPFATSSFLVGGLQPPAPAGAGFSSAQLLGQTTMPSSPASALGAPVSAILPVVESKSVGPVFAPAPEEIISKPASSLPTRSPLSATTPFASPAFSPPPVEENPAQAAVTSTRATPGKHSFLGLSPVDTQTDQLLLRALLGTEENLAAPRVVELLATQPGLSACVCLHGAHVLSHGCAGKSDAAEFQRQAPEIAKQLRALAPLIGIEGAETFTLNAGGRLLTFCFPGNTIVAVLHDAEPSNGLRDKITLISRELARLLG